MSRTLLEQLQTGQRNALLWWKARTLQASHLFVGADTEPLDQKQAIFLVLVGLKPVSEASSGHWVPTPGGRHRVYDDPAEGGSFLDSLGLVYQLRHDEWATDALVALEPELLDAYETASREGDQRRIGELFGYPPTAAEPFADGDKLLPVVDQERLERDVSPPPRFRLSRGHWQEEVAVAQLWASVLRLYGLQP